MLYGTSESPMGPFPLRGTVLEGDGSIAVAPGHNGYIYEPENDGYDIVYHRRELPDADFHARCLCIDKMFLKDGEILPVTMTR